MTGYVYAIRSECGLVKIGWSSDPIRRLSKIQSDTPNKCVLVGAYVGGRDLEAEIHDQLRPWRVRGEWFRNDGGVSRMLASMPRYISPVKSEVARNSMEYIRKNVLQISQAQMASIAQTSQANVSRWECGKVFPYLKQLEHIREEAQARGIEWNDSLFFNESPAPTHQEGEA